MKIHSLFLVSQIICQKDSLHIFYETYMYKTFLSISSFLALRFRNDNTRKLFPYLHFTWSATYCSQGCTIAKLPFLSQLQTIEKALLANYASNNSPVHRSRHRKLVEMQRGVPFRLPTSDGYVIAVYETFIAKCETVRLLRSGASERSSRLLETIHVSIHPRSRKRQINLKNGIG